MATSGKGLQGSLVGRFDEIVAGTNVLSSGIEQEFAEYLTYNIDFFSNQVQGLKAENMKLKGDNEAKDIQLKLSRKSLENQMNECTSLKDRLREYEKQFTILKALVCPDGKLNNLPLNEAERRSLALLKKTNFNSPGGFLDESIECPTFSDTSANVTDATLDDDDSCKAATWKRRRTASVEWALDSSYSKKRRSVEDFLDEREGESVLPPPLPPPNPLPPFQSNDLHVVSPLDRQFKKPPPSKNRRKPSRGHLHQMKQDKNLSPTPPPPEAPALPKTSPIVVPPLNLPQIGDDSPVPSAPSEHEVVLVNQGILSPHDHSPSPSPYSPCQPPPTSPYYEADPLALTPPLSSAANRLYPNLIEGGGDGGFYEGVGGATPIYQDFNGLGSRSSSNINLTRKHSFLTKTIMKSESCQVCKKKVGFGKSCLKCKDCRALCHSECKEQLPLPCVPTVHTPKKKQKDSDLSVFCPHSIPRVPSLIIHCVKEIESRGMNQVGLYRIPGNERAIKELKERLLTARGTPNFDKVEDVNVICGCLKQFLLQLQEPLVTNKLRMSFINAIDNEDLALASILESIALLPPCNKDTLAFVILHLQKVASNSEANKMPTASLARVFAPTIIGSSSSAESLFRDIQKQQQVVERLLNITPDYWMTYLSPEDNPTPQSPTPSQGTLTSPTTPPIMMSPSTPELLPIPQSPFLGPCQSPQGGRMLRTPVITRSTSSSSVTRSVKKGNTFFGAIN